MTHINLLKEYIELLSEKIRSSKTSKFGNDTKFNIKTFKNLEHIEQLVEYAKTFLEPLGTGSSRIAFLMSSKYALKIAINEKGLAQNETEVGVYTNPGSKPLVAAVHGADHGYKWLISDLVKPMSPNNVNEFESITGISFKELIEDTRQHTPKTKMGKALRTTMVNNDLLMGDVKEIDHWGKTSDGRIVLLDYGFTGEVWSKHYSSKPTGNSPTQKAPSVDDSTKKDKKTAPAKPQTAEEPATVKHGK